MKVWLKKNYFYMKKKTNKISHMSVKPEGEGSIRRQGGGLKAKVDMSAKNMSFFLGRLPSFTW